MNLWIIKGNLGHEPKSGTSQSGMQLAYMDVAVSADGGQGTDWVSVTAFNKTAENCLKYLHKGSEIVCWGNASARQWQRNDGSSACGMSMAANRVEFCRMQPQQEAAAAPQVDSQSGMAVSDDVDCPY